MGSFKRTHTVFQLEAAECGAASLAMVLGAFGRHVPLEELRAACGVSRDGSKASSILKAARAYGLDAKGLKAEPDHLADLKPPMIAFVNFCHFLVVEGVTAGKVYLNDPARGRRAVSHEEFDEMFTGVVLTFAPGPNFARADTRPSVWRSLFDRTRGMRMGVAFVFLISLLLVLPGIVTPVFSRIFVDNILVEGFDGWLWPLVGGILLTALLQYLLTEVQTWYLTRAETRMAVRGAEHLVAHMLRLPVAFFGVRFPGELSSRVGLSDALARLLTGEVARAALNLITAVFFLAMIVVFDPTIALAVAAISALNIAAIWVTSGWLTEIYQKIAIDQGKLAGAGIAGLKDIETFKASGAEDSFFARWSGLQANAVSGEQRFQSILAITGGIPVLLTATMTAAVLTLGGLAVMDGTLTLGGLVAVQALAGSFAAPVAQLANLGSRVQQLRSHTARVDDILRQPVDSAAVATPDQSVLATADPLPEALPRGHIRLDSVSFGHLPLEPPLIEGFSVDVPPGARLALVGRSGSGKSTLARIVVGLNRSTAGRVLLDNRPLDAWPHAAVAATLAYVDQEIVLFEGTVRDNLSLWNTAIPDADIVAAARDACIHDIIATRPGAYDSQVEEAGRNFSGGQRQRLELARALAVNPRVLVLDEATSALDPATEHTILENLRRRGCSLIVVAHRLSTVRDCDEIIVLDRGRAVERGTHPSLIRAGGSYAALVAV